MTGGPGQPGPRPDWGHQPPPGGPTPASRVRKPGPAKEASPKAPAKAPAAKRGPAPAPPGGGRGTRFAPPPPPSPPAAPPADARSAAIPSTASAKKQAAGRPGPSKAPTRGGPAKAAARPPAAGVRRPTAKTSRFRARYAVVHDIEGPRVRFGILWFLTATVAILAGPVATAIVYGGVAAGAAAQAARTWRARGAGASDVMAGGGAALMAGGAVFGAGGGGLGVIGAVALAFFAASSETVSPHPRISDIGYTLQCSLLPGLCALSVVLVTRYDQGSAIVLLLLVSAFETGDFLIGTSAKNPYEGPGAGAAAIIVVTFIVSSLPISALSFGEAWILGGAVVLLGPLGQFLASAALPAAASPAPALRRLDSLLLAAPLCAVVAGYAISH